MSIVKTAGWLGGERKEAELQKEALFHFHFPTPRYFPWTVKTDTYAKKKIKFKFRLLSFQIYSWMDTLVAKYPNLVTKQEIGRTYENRPMYVLKVGVNPCVCV